MLPFCGEVFFVLLWEDVLYMYCEWLFSGSESPEEVETVKFAEDGLAHVIEEGESFSRSFGREVILGMLDIVETDKAFSDYK